jgi:hypothetical protein
MINKQTTLDLNGPILSFVRQPTSTTVVSGASTTFVGIATATFTSQTPSNPATPTGSISYQWYNQNGALTDGANVVGSATTTLILSNNTVGVSQIFLRADYIPSAYGQDPITVGTVRSTGNAINDTLDSNVVSLSTYALISITSQPTAKTAAQNNNTTFTAKGEVSDGSIPEYQWYINGIAVSNGSNSISGATFTASGATSSTLTVSGDTVGTYNITVTISKLSASNSPITSNTAIFAVIAPRSIIKIETFEENGSSDATLSNINLNIDGTLNLDATNTLGLTSLYAVEKDINVVMDMYGAAGATSARYRGGQGGTSTIQFTMKKNEEYVITRIPASGTNGGVFLYRKAKLIAAVGAGGNPGLNGPGGNGGGIGIKGVNGYGNGNGGGGVLISTGMLPSNGIFGSIVSPTTTLLSGDTIASAPNGGRTISCSKGNYWRTQGYSACQDIGSVQFYRSDGSVVSNTATIDRGFKAGYSILTTSGTGYANIAFPGGDGGGGATGGGGGSYGGGGGGGSGYTDGSINILSTQQGGNPGVARIAIRLYVPVVTPTPTPTPTPSPTLPTVPGYFYSSGTNTSGGVVSDYFEVGVSGSVFQTRFSYYVTFSGGSFDSYNGNPPSGTFGGALISPSRASLAINNPHPAGTIDVTITGPGYETYSYQMYIAAT